MRVTPQRFTMAIGGALVICSILAATTAFPLQENAAATIDSHEREDVYRLPTNVKPLHYDIKLVSLMTNGNFTYSGESDIDLEILEATHDIILHMKGIELDKESTTLLCLVDTAENPHAPTTYNYDYSGEIMIIHFDEILEPNLCTLSIKFTGILNENQRGFYRCPYTDEAGEEMWIATTHFEPAGARRAFPCFDEPALKATFDISIQHYNNYTAISNMPILSQTPVSGDEEKVWTKFHRTPIMSTYLVAFVVADFVNVSNADGTINIWTRRAVSGNARYILGVAEKATAALEEYTNSSFRMPKMDHVAVTEFPAGAMENWGLIIYPESSLLYNESMRIGRKIRVTEIAVHELAHQWFGNVVSPAWWSYVWLNEGFAAYFQHYIVDKIVENLDYMDYFVVAVKQPILWADTSPYTHPISVTVRTPKDAESSFTSVTYSKTASVLRMLSHCLTEDVFRNGLISYLDAFKYKTATPSDLWHALQVALDESGVDDKFNVEEVMKTWTDQSGYPLVTVHRDYSSGTVTLTQQIFLPGTFDDVDDEEDDDSENNEAKPEKSNAKKPAWWIPISYTTQSDAQFSNARQTVWMNPHDANLTIEGIDSNDWIIVNLQAMGYYRVNYDIENWQKIIRYLDSDNYTRVHPLNRAQLLDDSRALLKMRQLDPKIYGALTNYLSREKNILPWITASRLFDNLEGLVLYNAEADFFKQRVSELMDGIIETVGFEDHPEENVLFQMYRRFVVYWACTVRNAACKRVSAEKAVEVVEAARTNQKLPDVEPFILCEGLRDANESMWNEILGIALNSTDEELIEVVACLENQAVLEQLLIRCLEENSTISEDITFGEIVQALGKNLVARKFYIDYVIKNWNTTKDIIGNRTDIFPTLRNVMIKLAYTQEQLNEIKDFFIANDITYGPRIRLAERKILNAAREASTYREWFQKTE